MNESVFQPFHRTALSLLVALAILQPSIAAVAPDLTTQEAEYYRLVTLSIPDGLVLEPGALQWMPDGKLAVATRIGEIYLVENALQEPPKNVRFTKFAEGVHEVLGLALRNGDLYATQRGEVTRIRDLDGDGQADVYQKVSDFWEISGDYHEYAFGSKFDPHGNIWVVLCLTGSFTSEVPWRGWALKVNADGTTIPVCSGLRSPGGIATNSLGDMFYTDNQGPWNGTSALKHLQPGGFMGHPAGNKWYELATPLGMGPAPATPKSGSRMHIEAERIPELIPPAVLFPYNKMGQSASGIINDASGGKFGPFRDQLFVADQTHSTVMRVFLEKVNGRYQGACFPFRQGLSSGSLSLEFAPDGSLLVGGTDRGWGSRGGKPYALERLVWTGQVPFEIHEMRAKPDGFELTFTQPLDPDSAIASSSYSLQTYTYIYQENYGSPEVDHTEPAIERVTLAPDRRSVRLFVDKLQAGHVHELHLPGLKSVGGTKLLHPVAYYTLNYIPQ